MQYKTLSLRWRMVRNIDLYPNYFWIIKPDNSPVFSVMFRLVGDPGRSDEC